MTEERAGSNQSTINAAYQRNKKVFLVRLGLSELIDHSIGKLNIHAIFCNHMPSLVFYKISAIMLLIITGGTTSATALYYQQQNTNLNANVSTLTADLNSTSHQLTTLNSQVSQLQTTNTQLGTQLQSQSNQISQLQDQITALQSKQAQGQTIVVSQGAIDLSGYGSTADIPFTVPLNLVTATLNVSLSVSGGYSIKSALLSESQDSMFLTCNCVFYGNYTPTTWLSPTVQTYSAMISVPFPGLWHLTFMEPPGTGSGLTLSETVKLTTQPSTGNTTQTVGSGTVMVSFNGISYIPFTALTVPATLNITFQITDTNSYYPQSIALYLLDQSQHTLFEAGNYTSSTWSYPYSTSISTTQVIIPSTGTWYLAFQEQDPNGGFPATANYSIQLMTLI